MATSLAIPVTRICTHSECSGEQYGAWSEEYTIDVGDVAIILKPKQAAHTLNDYPTQYETEQYEGELVEYEEIYVIVAIYSTGDSFGHASGGSYEVCSINKDSAVANRNLKALEKDEDAYEVYLENDNGTKYKFYQPWGGYFESLDSVQIYTMMVGKQGEDQ